MSIIYCIPYPNTYNIAFTGLDIYWILNIKDKSQPKFYHYEKDKLPKFQWNTKEKWMNAECASVCETERISSVWYYMFDVCMDSNDLISFYRWFFFFFFFLLYGKIERIFVYCVFSTFISCWVLLKTIKDHNKHYPHYLHK